MSILTCILVFIIKFVCSSRSILCCQAAWLQFNAQTIDSGEIYFLTLQPPMTLSFREETNSMLCRKTGCMLLPARQRVQHSYFYMMEVSISTTKPGNQAWERDITQEISLSWVFPIAELGFTWPPTRVGALLNDVFKTSILTWEYYFGPRCLNIKLSRLPWQ